MDRPLLQAIEAYRHRQTVRCHMPGHKGKESGLFGKLCAYDVTEIPGTDSLYDCGGPLRLTELRLSALYGAADSLLSAGGSSLCIQTMLAMAAKRGGTLIASRSIHVSAVNAMGLLGLDPVWVYPRGEKHLAGRVQPGDVEQALRAHPDALAVYITSPDYYGIVSDIAAIAAVCRKHSVPLLVDNAHGAHLKFMERDMHPITLGASACCDSLHKTLPALTGAAALHLGKDYAVRYEPDGRLPAPRIQGCVLYRRAKEMMSVFGSTSPSYLIMLSIEDCCAQLPSLDFRLMAERIRRLEDIALAQGMRIPEGERDGIKLVVDATDLGYTGKALAQRMRADGIEPEYADAVWAILLFSPLTEPAEYDAVAQFLESLPHGRPLPGHLFPSVLPEKCRTLPQAFLQESELLPVSECEGRIAAAVKSPCPPGIPVVMPGEKIDRKLIKLLNDSGILLLKVLK
ncbi:DegT/DnrJ/EryC1/StrS family aminotransferase [Candidatus Soleaferrea massiliensis]|uniref:Orn/Lys/Arg family decarboxylase n=1 Tax=Candidatus Soleaferrea massiliensis TaxID=1470354 RepID=UPI0005904608|nr:DegT/DnrJ/EryC1/StrS family aminotransferase [Candidatus Soleaferrea massiliensis]